MVKAYILYEQKGVVPIRYNEVLLMSFCDVHGNIHVRLFYISLYAVPSCNSILTKVMPYIDRIHDRSGGRMESQRGLSLYVVPSCNCNLTKARSYVDRIHDR